VLLRREPRSMQHPPIDSSANAELSRRRPLRMLAPPSSTLAAQLEHQRTGVLISPRFATRTRSRNVELSDRLGPHEPNCPPNALLDRDARRIHDEVCAPKLLAELDRSRRAATRRAECDDEGPVAIFHVLVCTLIVPSAAKLGNRVARRDHAVLSHSAGGTPPTARYAEFQRRIEGAAIDTGLTPRDYAKREHGC
jgi:hypothetical protein